MKQTGIMIEGGAMRSVFAAGVLDFFMEKGIEIPNVLAVSAGAYAGMNYVSGQSGRAVDAVIKPLEKEKFFHAMDIALEVIGKAQEGPIIIKTSGGGRQIYPDQILYCETQKNYQILYLGDEELKVRMTGRELYEILEGFSQFLRCGSSYIVNLNHIIAVDREEIRMDSGDRIYLPRNRAAEFKKKYFAFYFGGVAG